MSFPLLLILFAIMAGCNTGSLVEADQIDTLNLDDIRGIARELGNNNRFQARDRVLVIEQIVKKMHVEGRDRSIAPFLGLCIQYFGNDPYRAYYLYLTGKTYADLGQEQIAQTYYRRSLRTAADVVVQGESIHLQSIERLLDDNIGAEDKIGLYNDLIAGFSDKINLGQAYYFLGHAYEQAGRYSEAFKAYARFLEFPNTVIPGKVDEHKRIKALIALSGSSRDWTRVSLDQLIAEIRTALSQKDTDTLTRLQAKVNFFSMSWLQDEEDFNSQVNQLRRFVQGSSHIFSENTLEGNSNSQEAFLKTWGWSTYIPTWYLNFRRVNYPADPEINGNWEWIGIYFGDLLQ